MACEEVIIPCEDNDNYYVKYVKFDKSENFSYLVVRTIISRNMEPSASTHMYIDTAIGMGNRVDCSSTITTVHKIEA